MASKIPLALYSGDIKELQSMDTLALSAIPTPLTGKDADTLDGYHASAFLQSVTAHQLDGALHTVSGLTPGHFLKALTATTFGFAVHGLSYGDVGALAVGGTAADSDKLDGEHGSYYAISGAAPAAHALIDATGHTVSGLTTGHFLKATGATTYGFGAHGLSYGDVGADQAGAAAARQAAFTILTTLGNLSNTSGWLHNDGAGALVYSTPTAANVGAEASGAVSTHAALTTGIHGLAITAGQTLTVTAGGTLGTAAFTATGAYEAAGAIATHAALITGVHGLVFTTGKTLTLTESLTFNAAGIGALRVATAANTIGNLAVGLTTQVLIGGGAATVPAWSADLPTAVTIGSGYIYRVSGTDVAVADGGTAKSSWTQYCIPYASTTTVLSEIAIGGVGKVLTVAAGATGYEWTTPLVNPMTNVGDLIQGGTAGAPGRLADVGAGSYLRSGGVNTAVVWSTLNLPDTITAGYIPFASAANQIGSDANLFWDNSNKRLGIGTVAPAYPLDIKGTGIQVRIGNTGSVVQKQLSFVSSAGQVYVGQESNAGGNIFTATSAYAAVFGTNQNYPVEFCVAGTMHLSLSYVGNLRLGGTALRNNIEGTNVVNVFNGTAPVGTLANGCSIYSTSGELYTMDTTGNATLQTPHNKKGEWIFYSKNTVTGKVLQIDMERMMRMLNKKFDGDFIREYVEQIQN